MRAVSLDTETTGFSPDNDRIVDIGCVEVINDFPTKTEPFQRYLNPEMPMPEDAFKVHGLSDEFLKDKPKFADVVDELLEFLGDSMLIIHNASFDLRFINAELARCGRPPLTNPVRDTLQTAKKKLPVGSLLSLDALCKRAGISNAHRSVHGALLDATLLVDVNIYLEGKGELALTQGQAASFRNEGLVVVRKERPPRAFFPVPESECALHGAFLEFMSQHLQKSGKTDAPLWRDISS